MFDSLSFVNDDSLVRKSASNGKRTRYNTIKHDVTGAWWVSVGLLKAHLLSEGNSQQVVICRPNAHPKHAPRIVANGKDMTLYALAKLCGVVWACWSGYNSPGVYPVLPITGHGSKWKVSQMGNKFTLTGGRITSKGYACPNPVRDNMDAIDSECKLVLNWMAENQIADVIIHNEESYRVKRKDNDWPEFDCSDFNPDQIAVLQLVGGEPRQLPEFDSLDWSDFDCVRDNNAALEATM